jgi:hypothetical protein
MYRLLLSCDKRPQVRHTRGMRQREDTHRRIINLYIQLVAESLARPIVREGLAYCLDVEGRVAGKVLTCRVEISAIWPAVYDDSNEMQRQEVLHDLLANVLRKARGECWTKVLCRVHLIDDERELPAHLQRTGGRESKQANY